MFLAVNVWPAKIADALNAPPNAPNTGPNIVAPNVAPATADTGIAYDFNNVLPKANASNLSFCILSTFL